MRCKATFSGARCPSVARSGLLALLLLCNVDSQTHARQQLETVPPIDRQTQEAIIDSVTAVLREEYVFPDVAAEMTALLRKNLNGGAYRDITDPADFTLRMTDDLRSVSHDRHLTVRYLPRGTQREERTLTPEARRQRRLEQLRAQNFGFQKAEILRGNIGYLDFRFFAEAKHGGATAIAAMNFLAYTEALIFDLRNNGGGNPSMIQLLSSYLFEDPVHLNSFYIRKGDSTKQFWTQDYVEGAKLTEIPVYILTSSSTFSGAEEFAYNLKNLKRATIIGETTGGGAHPVNLRSFPTLNVSLAVPFGRAVNPITGTNWERVGVEPDIVVAADKALVVARTEAVNQLIGNTTDELKKRRLTWMLDELAVEMNPLRLPDSVLMACAGTYGPRSVRFEDRTLYYQREGRPEFRLIPMGDDRFMVETLDYFRLQFHRDSSGKVIELVGQYDNGDTDVNVRIR